MIITCEAAATKIKRSTAAADEHAAIAAAFLLATVIIVRIVFLFHACIYTNKRHWSQKQRLGGRFFFSTRLLHFFNTRRCAETSLFFNKRLLTRRINGVY